jgi:hypothetical protein
MANELFIPDNDWSNFNDFVIPFAWLKDIKVTQRGDVTGKISLT